MATILRTTPSSSSSFNNNHNNDALAIERTAAYLRSLYDGLSFPTHYGEEQTDKLCKTSASFGHNQTPPDLFESAPKSPELLSLWMLIGWAIDNVFDTYRDLTTSADVVALIKILDLDPIESNLEAHVLAAASLSPAVVEDAKDEEVRKQGRALIDSLLESTNILYNDAYVKGVQPYVEANPGAWKMLKTWYSRYIAHVRNHQKFEKVEDFMKFRLADVGIMCQYAQVMLFKGRAPEPQDEAIWCQATLAIAAINDVASFQRDIVQGTANLLGVRMQEVGATAWETVKWADETAHELEVSVGVIGESAVDPYVAKVAAFSVSNARDWHMTHPRYAKGIQLLMARRNAKPTVFEALLCDDKRDVAQADPRSIGRAVVAQ